MKQEDLWELRIKNVEEKDSGLFECQVNTFIKCVCLYISRKVFPSPNFLLLSRSVSPSDEKKRSSKFWFAFFSSENENICMKTWKMRKPYTDIFFFISHYLIFKSPHNVWFHKMKWPYLNKGQVYLSVKNIFAERRRVIHFPLWFCEWLSLQPTIP